MSKTVSIEYKPMNDLDKLYPDVAREVIVPDDWTNDRIEKWYTDRHSHVNHVGIKVMKINELH